MRTYKVTIKRSNYFVKEIEAKDFEDAMNKAKLELWHSRYENWGSSYEDETIDEITNGTF